MAEKVFIYSLSHPTTGEVRYIGKANNLKKRLATHIQAAKRKRTPIQCWIYKLLSESLKPEIKAICVVDMHDWERAEKEAIAEYKQSYDLLNIAVGGNEPKRSKDLIKERRREMKKALSLALKRGVLTENIKEKMRQAARLAPTKYGHWVNI